MWSDEGAIDVARLTLQFFVLAVVAAGLAYMAGKHKRAFVLTLILMVLSIGIFVANRAWSAYKGEEAAKAREAVAAEDRATQAREAAAAQDRAARAREAAAAEARAAQAREAAADEELRSQVREEEAEAAAAKARAARVRQAAKAEAEARRRVPQNELKKITVTPMRQKWDVNAPDWSGEGGRAGSRMTLQFRNGTSIAFYAVKLIVRYQHVLTNEIGQYESQDFARLVKIAYPGSNAECYADFDPPPGDDTHAEDRFRLLQITVSAALRPEASSTESAPDLSDSGGVRANKAATQPTVSP